MRPYGHYCGIARALDVVGDRWSLLVVRELLSGPRRYGELLDGLPGVATNLLAERLRQLATAGVVEHRDDGRYRLTEWGEGLRDPLYALARWAAPVVMTRPAGDDAFRSEWLTHPVGVLFGGIDERRAPLRVEVRSGEDAMTIESAGGAVAVRRGSPDRPDLVLDGPPDAVLGLLAGALDPETARALGIEITGDVRRLAGLGPPDFPGPVAATRPGPLRPLRTRRAQPVARPGRR